MRSILLRTLILLERRLCSLVIFSIASLLFCTHARLPAAHHYSLNGNSYSIVTSADVRLVSARELIDPEERSRKPNTFGAWFRDSEFIKPSHKIPTTLFSENTTHIKSQDDGVFQLWSVGDVYYENGLDVAILSFVVDTHEEFFVNVSADYSYWVYVDEEPVVARIGYRSFQGSTETIKITPSHSSSRITIACRRLEGPGFSTNAPPWRARIALTADRNLAIERSFREPRCLLDTPGVKKLTSIRVLNPGLEGYSVTLHNSNSEPVAFGTITEEGNINWHDDVSQLGYGIYFVEISPSKVEAILFTDDLSRVFLSEKSKQKSDFWSRRVEVLSRYKAQKNQLSLTWMRKLSLAYANTLASGRSLEAFKRRHIEIHSYKSKIDGEPSFNAFFVPDSQKEVLPVLVVVPTVNSIVRTFDESGIIADIDEQMSWIETANELEVGILWPGFSDIDSGGKLSGTMLRESLSEFHTFVHRKIAYTLYGTCSAGRLIVQNIKHFENIDSVIFQSPEILRRSATFTPNIKLDTRDLAKVSGSTWSDLDPSITALQRLRKIVYTFDTAMPDHGDEANGNRLVAALKKGSINVDVVNFERAREFLWGRELQHRIRVLVKVLLHDVSETQQILFFHKQRDQSISKSVVERLSNGYHFSEPFKMMKWRDKWKRSLRTWRLTDFEFPSRSEGSTPIVSIIGDEALQFLSHLDVPTSVKNKLSKSTYFYVSVDPLGTDNRVILGASDLDAAPNIDPLIDGEYSLSLWFLESNKWVCHFSR
jgi:hypothetical protein